MRNIFINCYKNTNFSQCFAHLRKVFEKFPEKFVFICQTIKFVSKNNLSQVVLMMQIYKNCRFCANIKATKCKPPGRTLVSVSRARRVSSPPSIPKSCFSIFPFKRVCACFPFPSFLIGVILFYFVLFFLFPLFLS